MSEDPFDQLEELLASLFGPQTAGDAVDALRASGVDPQTLAQVSGISDLTSLSPGQIMAVRSQLTQMFASSAGENLADRKSVV